MRAIVRKTLADIRRRRVQTVVVAMVVFLSSATATLALTLLVDSDAPFDRAFNQVQGAHLFVSFDANQVTGAQLQATGSLPAVSAVGGPWRVSPASIALPGGRTQVIPVAGRQQPGGPVDRVVLDSGRWVQQPGEVVISRDLADRFGFQVGDSLPPALDSPLPALRIVGVATSLGSGVTAWVTPDELPRGATQNYPAQYLMAYRLHHASTPADIASAVNAITAMVPAGSVQDTSNYLTTKLNADRTTAVMIPFLLAFSVFALLASTFIIANLVGGAVIAATREIGIMKSVGFTPAQVVTTFAGQMLIPAGLGCLLGMPAGVVLSQPFLIDTAHAFGLPPTFDPLPPVDLVGVLAILAVVIGTTVLASQRAGRLSAAAAIAAGSSPSTGRGLRLSWLAARLPLPRSLTLGIGESFARPIRSAMTVAAILIGVATVTFAVGLHNSLTMVASAVTRDQQVQVDIYPQAETKSGLGGMSQEQVASLIATQPGTARFVGEGHADLVVAGVANPVPVTAYQGDASWLGYVPIHGRWFSAPGEAVAPTAFFTATNHRIGDTIATSLYGQAVHFKLVGEIFDTQGDGILLRTSTDSLPANLAIWTYEVQLRPGTDARGYARAIESSGSGLSTRLNNENGIETAFLLINSVLAGLALVLAMIAISGVFNTVVLNTRERARDLAILKAVGMTPRQVITMIVASVTILGVIGAATGIPAGVALHRNILVLMGQIAAATAVPDPFFKAFSLQTLGLLGGAGIAIAAIGAFVPSLWAARSGVSEVLQAE